MIRTLEGATIDWDKVGGGLAWVPTKTEELY